MLKLEDKDKIVFMEKNGKIVSVNSNHLAFEEFQREMMGEAEKSGLNSEQDVVDLGKEVCGKMWETQHGMREMWSQMGIKQGNI